MLDKKTVLKQYFGHSEFRDGQEEVVDAIMRGEDALCIMPTGGGKSICYQVPAMLLEGMTVVISPLISLMKDQVNALTQNGIDAAYLNSSLSYTQYVRVLENIRRGIYKIVYVAPERLAVSDFASVCRGIKIDLLAVDEAHCVSQWGQDFRPSYLKIADFVNTLGCRPRVAAFTATATAQVKKDIEYSLKLKSPFRITTGFDRPNLKFEVLRPKHKFDELLSLLRARADKSGIIYCSTRKTVDEVGKKLCEAGFSATVYHAGLDDDVRRQNQEDFVYDRRSIIVATNAFGMGIDKSNVSYVIHYNMPMDIESYYQEAGRAGRDGNAADCILLYSKGDVMTNQYLIEHSEPNPDLTPDMQELIKERDYERLKMMTFYSTASTCLRSFILNYFGERSSGYCGNCSSCLTQFTEVDITADARKILACISQTGERFGKKLICDIIRGSNRRKIVRWGLDTVPAYGELASHKEPHLRAILDHLEYEGYITSNAGKYPTLSLTPKAEPVLSGEATVAMKIAKPKAPDVRGSKKSTMTSSAETATAATTPDQRLFAELKALRRTIADEEKVPAYIVFTDAALLDMCKKHPTTREGFLAVSGVGKVKLDLFGDRFLELLIAHKKG